MLQKDETAMVHKKIHALIQNLIHLRDTTGEYLLTLADGTQVDQISFETWEWTSGIGLYGMMKYYLLFRDQEVLSLVTGWFDRHLGKNEADKNINTMVQMLTLAMLYEKTGNVRYRNCTQEWAEWLYHDLPRTERGGFEHMTFGPRRYEQMREYRNDIQSPWRLNSIGKLLVSSDGRKVDTLLDGVFSSPSMDNETARHIALELYLKAHSFDNEISVDAAADWFRKIYTCRDIQQVEEICRMFALRKNEHFGSSAQSNIAAIKAYVKAHYGDEELTLKWLAKNYLFCNEQYLSKQFVKEEKMRFSDYLNTVRMKKAKQLMALYRNDDIKDIAAEVGFENNPRYFSQVFKKYTGMTPSEYLAQLEV